MSKFTWKTSPVIKRFEGNPILSPKDVPYPTDMVYNAGVVKWHGRYCMVFRYLHFIERFEKSTRGMGLAFSDDGIKWKVSEKRCAVLVDGRTRERPYTSDDFKFSPYRPAMPEDPRLTVVDDRVYMCFADNTPQGLRGTIAVTDDFEHFEILSAAVPDDRNMVLFPEKINGKFVRLERPMPMYGRREKEAFETWYADSPDCRYWGNIKLLLKYDDVPFCNTKNGPSGQPLKTDKGWLTLFHATHTDPDTVYPTWRNENWHKLYCVGIMLLDLKDPSKIVGLSPEPLMVPEPPYTYETDGFRSYTLFPCATLLEKDDLVRIYYGACDTVTCLATAKLKDLIWLCKPVKKAKK